MTSTPTDSATAQPRARVASRVRPLVAALLADADALRLGISRCPSGATLVDAGMAAAGGLEAGRRIAEICLGGLGRVTLGAASPPLAAVASLAVGVTAADPVLACLGSQYAGLSLSHGEGDAAWRALGSGPARAQAAQETLYEELGYRDEAPEATLVIEVDRAPPPDYTAEIAALCGVPAERLTLILTPTASLAGTVQIVARVLEVALHKAHALGFALERIVDGAAAAPLPPPAPGFLDAMGRTNDAILFGGTAQLYVRGPDAEAADLAARLPSTASRDFGRPFAELFQAAGYDFYAIDPMLFSPAAVAVTALDSGRTFTAGGLRPDLLARSFGLAAAADEATAGDA